MKENELFERLKCYVDWNVKDNLERGKELPSNEDVIRNIDSISDYYYKECFDKRLPEYIDNYLDYVIENINDGNITETYEIVDYAMEYDNTNGTATYSTYQAQKELSAKFYNSEINEILNDLGYSYNNNMTEERIHLIMLDNELNNKLNEHYENVDSRLKEEDALKYTLYDYLNDEGYTLKEEYQKEYELLDEIIVGNLTYDDLQKEKQSKSKEIEDDWER